MTINTLIVEDDAEVATAVLKQLHAEGHLIHLATNTESARNHMTSRDISLVILDVNLSEKTPPSDYNYNVFTSTTEKGQEGFELASWIRDNYPDTRVIFLTSLSSIGDRVRGLDLGGDDYLVKPIDGSEFRARVRAVTRRINQLPPQEEIFGRWSYNFQTGEISHLDNKTMKPIRLSFSEGKIIGELVRAKGQTVSRESLSKRAFGRPITAGDRAVDTIISKLRNKIDISSTPSDSIIETVYGGGYRLRGF